MTRYAYFLLIALYLVVLVVSAYKYLSKPAPQGDATVDWAQGIFFLGSLLLITLLALLLWKKQGIGFLILCLPLLFLALPGIKRTLTDWYASAPTLSKIPPLTLFIQNNTPAMIHVKLDCWFATSDKGTASLYQTMDYYLGPHEKMDTLLNPYETGLLAQKSKFVSVTTYERVKAHYQGAAFIREIQPCMQYYEEKTEAFRNGRYSIVIDESNNTETFKSEVKMRKEQNDYDSGVF